MILVEQNSHAWEGLLPKHRNHEDIEFQARSEALPAEMEQSFHGTIILLEQ